MARREIARLSTLAVALAVCSAPVALGQAPAPLRKTDLVRLLTNPSLSKGEVANRIRAACLAFDPTGRDRMDLITLGADAAVMAQISECVRRKTAEASARQADAPAAQPRAAARAPAQPASAPAAAAPRAAQPAPPPAPTAGGAFRVLALRSRVSVAAGSDALLQILVTGRTGPVVGVPVKLDRVPRPATTDARGLATFRLRAGNKTGLIRLPVASVGGQAVTGPQVEIVTVAGPAARVDVQPRRLEARRGQAAQRRPVRITVRDAFGNPVGGGELSFRPLTPGIGVGAFNAKPNAAGALVLMFPTNALRRDGEIGIYSGAKRLGTLSVVTQPVVLAEAATQFVSGTEQRGVAGKVLTQPLVLEVRDTKGAPVSGETVRFAVTNGALAPAATVTDARGRAYVRVRAGRRVGQTLVTASVGTVQKQASITVGPGPAARLIVQRDQAPVAGAVELNSTNAVYLWVKAQDSLGNDVPVTQLRASASDRRVLHVARAEEVRGMGRVELRAQATGSSRLDLQVAGLRQTVATQVLLPPLPRRPWVVGVRAGYTMFSYTYRPTWKGQAGPVAEVSIGRKVGRGLTLSMAATFAPLKVDTSSTGPYGVTLLDTSMRLEYAATLQGNVSPVVLLGAGSFQTSGALGDAILHVSYFWLAGGGVDLKMQPGMTGEIRATAHRLMELTSTTYNAPVGWLIAVTAGLRFGF